MATHFDPWEDTPAAHGVPVWAVIVSLVAVVVASVALIVAGTPEPTPSTPTVVEWE